MQNDKPVLGIYNYELPSHWAHATTGKISSLLDVQDAYLVIRSNDLLATMTPEEFRIETKQGRTLDSHTAKLEKISIGKETAYLYKFEKPRSVEADKTLPSK